MTNLKTRVLSLLVAGLVAAPALAGHHSKPATVVDVAVGSEAHTTLVTAVKAAGLVETLQSDGPFTVFAPTNEAFGKLPDGTVANLLKPESKDALSGVLTYHVVPGKLMAADVLAAIEQGDGKAVVTTVQGGSLTAAVMDGKVVLTDAQGNTSTVTATDLAAKNGVVHVIDTVVMP